MADEIRCPFCHKWIDERDYDRHERRHARKREDGQQTDYATLPEEDRDDGDLEGVPTVYVHRKCSVATEMPEEIVRSYLKNPYLYSADATFCCGCGKHVPFSQCEWDETGENLQDYMDNLRDAKPEMKPKGCFGMVLLFVGVGLTSATLMLA